MNNYKRNKNSKTRSANGKSKNTTSSTRDNDLDKSAQYKIDGRTKHNDASWYTKGSQLVLDAGRLAYAQPLGAVIDFDVPYTVGTIGGSSDPGKYRLPGVMELRYAPTVGVVNENADPVNISMRNIYSWIRHANSGHVNYDAPDLMLYLLGMDSVYQLYAHMCRAYGAVRLFSQVNRHVPFTIFKALGINYEDVLQNMSDFRAFINTFGVRIGSFAVPNTMDYFTRHLWMSSGIYMDAPTMKSQAYVFTPGILGKYVETDGAGYLDPVTTLQTNRNMTVADFISLGNELLNSIVASEDFGIMSGDILKAYTADQLIKVLPIADDFTVIPAYSEEVLRQIQNATLFNGSIGFRTGKYIYQDVDTNTLRSGVTVYTGNRAIEGRRFMLSNVESPTPDEVMVDSRLSVLGNVSAEGTDDFTIEVTSCGSEIIYGGFLHFMTVDGFYLYAPIQTYPTFTNPHIALDTITRVSQFGFHPLLYPVYPDTDNTRMYIVGDIQNYTVVDDIELSKMHTAALLSLFDVPQVGR